MIAAPLAVTAALAALVWVALRLERRHPAFEALGAALLAVGAAMLLSNVGFLPRRSAAYDLLTGTGIDIGIVLILLSVDLRTVATVDVRMARAFGLALAGTVAGAVIGGLLLVDLVGPETWKLAGQYAGTYSGGGVNFAAVGRAVGTSAPLFTAAIGADVIVTAVWLMVCLAAPLLLGRRGKPRSSDAEARSRTTGSRDAATRSRRPGAASAGESPGTGVASLDRALVETGRTVDLSDLAALVVVTFGVLWLTELLTTLAPGLPSVLWLTTIALVLAQVPGIKALAGGAMVGNYLVILFLVANGAMSVLATILTIGPAVFYYAMAVVAIHGVVLFGVGRLLRLDLPTLVVASQAAIGGPPTALALASARGYADRLVPGIVVGLLGYAGGNYVGLGVAAVMKVVLAG